MQINLLHLDHVIHAMCTKLLSGKDSISTNSVQLGDNNNAKRRHIRLSNTQNIHISSNLLLIPVLKCYRSSKVFINAQVCILYAQKKTEKEFKVFLAKCLLGMIEEISEHFSK